MACGDRQRQHRHQRSTAPTPSVAARDHARRRVHGRVQPDLGQRRRRVVAQPPHRQRHRSDIRGDSVIEGNYIGVNVNGTAALGNLGAGIQLGAADIHVGGGSPATRNVISGHTNNGQGINVGYNSFGSTLVGSADARDHPRQLHRPARRRQWGDPEPQRHQRVGAQRAHRRDDGGRSQRDLRQTRAASARLPPCRSTRPRPSLSDRLDRAGQLHRHQPEWTVGDGQRRHRHRRAGGNSTIGGTTGVTVGGACTGACNLVSATASRASLSHSFDYIGGALYATAAGTTIAGNYVGLDVLGTGPNSNSNGIQVNSPMVLVGGGTPARRNLVAGNTGQGI